MLLKEIEAGRRFMFTDRNTPLALTTAKGQHSADGVFLHVGTGEAGCPKLRSENTGREVIAVANTYYRTVLVMI